MILKRFLSVYRDLGLAGVLRALWRRARTFHARSVTVCRRLIADRTGLEIGGPSPIFARGGLLSLYPVAGRVDNCNFARNTLWEGTIQEGDSFVFHPGKAPGRQIIAEGADLASIPAAAYDFVLSSHMLEHTANPLRALAGWKRLLKPGGVLVLVLPHRDGTFDHRRPVTPLAHIVEDFESQRGEDDTTHAAEVLELHDVSRDPGVSDQAAFRDRIARNLEVRSLHHHVFDTPLAVAVVRRAGFEVVDVEPLPPYHIVVIGRNAAGSADALGEDALRATLRRSPFPSDRR